MFLRYTGLMPQTKTHKIYRHAFPMSIGAILLVCSIIVSQTSFSGQLSAMLQEESLNEIVQKTYEEYDAMRALPAFDEEPAVHASAPAERGWVMAVVDEVARWFGLQN